MAIIITLFGLQRESVTWSFSPTNPAQLNHWFQHLKIKNGTKELAMCYIFGQIFTFHKSFVVFQNKDEAPTGNLIIPSRRDIDGSYSDITVMVSVENGEVVDISCHRLKLFIFHRK